VAFLRYVAVRLGQALATLIGVSLLIFVAQRLLPGGFEEMLLGPLTTPEAKRFIVEQYGLDRSPVEQYFAWLLAFAQGDFGLSLITKSSIGAELWRRSPVTVELAVLATTMALLIGLPLGVASGIRESGRALRLIGRLIGAVGTGTPEFVLGSALLYLLSGWSMGFSARGYVSIFEAPRENLGALFVPAGTLAVFGAALIVRTTRDAVQRTLTEGHIVTAVARGDAPIGIVCHHVLRNAAIPIVTVTATFLGYLLGGALIVEVLFSIPGVGLYAYNALNNRDYAVVQAGVMLSATVFIMINTIADLLYALIDPRVARRIAASAARRR
jgi:peptide/nickel transport system permease protein